MYCQPRLTWFISIFDRYAEYNAALNSTSAKDDNETTLGFVSQCTTYPPAHSKQRALAESIALNLVVDCAAPLSVVTKGGFWRLKSIDSNINKMSRYLSVIDCNSLCR